MESSSDSRSLGESSDEFTEESFFDTTPSPHEYDNYRREILSFVDFHVRTNRKMALVTSGGTTVPLEHNTVRFVDNFSAGTRGSSSAEYFLDQGYAVIFLFRLKSLEPFKRHFVSGNFLDHLQTKTDLNGKRSIEVSDESVDRIFHVLQRYHEVKEQNLLLNIPFTTLTDYLWMLKTTAEAVNSLGKNAMLYLAAAVSDFYLPQKEMSTHKIPSSTPLQMQLKLVPKMLRPLVKKWAPEAYVTSFKLETDPALLISRARDALAKYEHEIVVANILETRKHTVTLVTVSSHHTIHLAENDTTEIEKIIVESLVKRHADFIAQ